jgi:hypothetical protein
MSVSEKGKAMNSYGDGQAIEEEEEDMGMD